MASVLRVRTPEGWAVLDSRGVPVAEVTGYLRYLRSVERSPNTVKAYASDLALFHSYLEHSSTAWTAVTNEVLGKFVAYLRAPSPDLVSPSNPQGRRARSTVNRALTAVTGLALYLADATGDDVYTHLMRTARRSVNPYSEHGRAVVRVGPRLPPGRATRYLLSDDEVSRIIESCARLRDKLLFTLLNETGMRIGQALQLRHSDVRVAESYIRVVRHEDGSDETLARNKSQNFAYVPVPAHLIRLYAAYQHIEYRNIDSDFVFVNLWAGELGKPLSTKSVEGLIGRLRRKTGIYRWSAHTFRHTYITRLLSRGVSPKTVSYLATHASVMTTLGTYNHVNVAFLREELEKAGIWS